MLSVGQSELQVDVRVCLACAGVFACVVVCFLRTHNIRLLCSAQIDTLARANIIGLQQVLRRL